MRGSAAVAAVLLFALAASGGAAGGPAAPREFAFPELNKTYTDFVSEFAPIEQGGLTVALTSPRQVLVLKENHVRLEPAGAGGHKAHLELRLFGSGWLVADLTAAGMSTRLQDELLVPEQTVVVDGKAKLERVEGGYRVTPTELPPQVLVKIQSKVTNGLLNWCDRVSVMPFMSLDCPALERSLTTVAVPMPPRGQQYLLRDADLTAADRAALDDYLSVR